MQRTIAIDDDVFEAAQKLAEAQEVPVDTVISDLARKGLQSTVVLEDRGGLPVFQVPAGVKPITTEDVRRGEDEP